MDKTLDSLIALFKKDKLTLSEAYDIIYAFYELIEEKCFKGMSRKPDLDYIG